MVGTAAIAAATPGRTRISSPFCATAHTATPGAERTTGLARVPWALSRCCITPLLTCYGQPLWSAHAICAKYSLEL